MINYHLKVIGSALLVCFLLTGCNAGKTQSSVLQNGDIAPAPGERLYSNDDLNYRFYYPEDYLVIEGGEPIPREDPEWFTVTPSDVWLTENTGDGEDTLIIISVRRADNDFNAYVNTQRQVLIREIGQFGTDPVENETLVGPDGLQAVQFGYRYGDLGPEFDLLSNTIHIETHLRTDNNIIRITSSCRSEHRNCAEAAVVYHDLLDSFKILTNN